MKIKKVKGTKKCVVKRKLKFEDYKHSLEATQLENKMNHVEKNNLNVDNLQENYKKLININKVILNSQQRFGREKQNVFIEEVSKVTLSANDNEVTQLDNSIEICAYGTSKDLVYKIEKIKCNNIIKQYKNK